eukprot:g2630.t1
MKPSEGGEESAFSRREAARAAGISEFLDNSGELSGVGKIFSAKLKVLPEDFVVCEIAGQSEHDEVVAGGKIFEELTMKDLQEALWPRREKIQKQIQDEDAKKEDGRQEDVQWPALSDEIKDAILQLANTVSDNPQNKSTVRVGNLQIISDKDMRRRLHLAIAKTHPQLATRTEKNADGNIDAIVIERDRTFDCLHGIFSDGDVRAIQNFKSREEFDKKLLLASTAGLDKASRRQIHIAFQKHFRKEFKSTTVSADGGTSMVAIEWVRRHKRAGKRAAGGRERKRKREDEGYVKLLLMKSNISQEQALHTLARAIGISSGEIGIAGTKDKRAVTYQFVTLPRDCNRQQAHGTPLSSPEHIKIGGPLKIVPQALHLGDSRGNTFQLVCKNVRTSVPFAAIRDSFLRVARNGFINYFGLQRLGNSPGDSNPQDIGLCILKKEWSTAVQLIMKPRAGDGVRTVEAKTLFASKGAAQALKVMPKSLFVERQILRGLRRFPDSPERVMKNLPYRVHRMFMHAYQSLLWNIMASARMKSGPRWACEGDLYISGASPLHRGMGLRSISGEQLRTLKQDEKGCLENVVIPLVGKSTLPLLLKDGAASKALQAQVNEDGISLEEISMQLPGAYRRLISPLEGASISSKIEVCDEGVGNCFRVEFSLPAGSYATVALRAIARNDDLLGTFSQ